MSHIPVLLHESLEHLLETKDLNKGSYLDATFGRGGHSEALLKRLGDGGHLYVCDRDLHAIEKAQSLKSSQITAYHCNYSEVFDHIPESLDGVLADFGLCSYQLDDPERGFSFRKTGPLDMRMDQTQNITVLDIIKKNNPKSLADLIYLYGEERRSRPIAREIYEKLYAGQLNTTEDLAECAIKFYPRNSEKHPATRLFQALRIATNNEMKHIENFLFRAGEHLKVGGKLVLITFHSLEYTLVKTLVRDLSDKHRHNEHPWALKKLLHPLFPSDAETQRNPRSRSARLHVFEKIQNN